MFVHHVFTPKHPTHTLHHFFFHHRPSIASLEKLKTSKLLTLLHKKLSAVQFEEWSQLGEMDASIEWPIMDKFSEGSASDEHDIETKRGGGKSIKIALTASPDKVVDAAFVSHMRSAMMSQVSRSSYRKHSMIQRHSSKGSNDPSTVALSSLETNQLHTAMKTFALMYSVASQVQNLWISHGAAIQCIQGAYVSHNLLDKATAAFTYLLASTRQGRKPVVDMMYPACLSLIDTLDQHVGDATTAEQVCALLAMLGEVEMMLGHLDLACSHLCVAHQGYISMNSTYHSIETSYTYGYILKMKGNVKTAVDIMVASRYVAVSNGFTSLASRCTVTLAELFIDCGLLEAAIKLLEGEITTYSSKNLKADPELYTRVKCGIALANWRRNGLVLSGALHPHGKVGEAPFEIGRSDDTCVSLVMDTLSFNSARLGSFPTRRSQMAVLEVIAESVKDLNGEGKRELPFTKSAMNDLAKKVRKFFSDDTIDVFPALRPSLKYHLAALEWVTNKNINTCEEKLRLAMAEAVKQNSPLEEALCQTLLAQVEKKKIKISTGEEPSGSGCCSSSSKVVEEPGVDFATRAKEMEEKARGAYEAIGLDYFLLQLGLEAKRASPVDFCDLFGGKLAKRSSASTNKSSKKSTTSQQYGSLSDLEKQQTDGERDLSKGNNNSDIGVGGAGGGSGGDDVDGTEYNSLSALDTPRISMDPANTSGIGHLHPVSHVMLNPSFQRMQTSMILESNQQMEKPGPVARQKTADVVENLTRHSKMGAKLKLVMSKVLFVTKSLKVFKRDSPPLLRVTSTQEAQDEEPRDIMRLFSTDDQEEDLIDSGFKTTTNLEVEHVALASTQNFSPLDTVPPVLNEYYSTVQNNSDFDDFLDLVPKPVLLRMLYNHPDNQHLSPFADL